ncbi:MAG TPA: YjbH domain-containing protein [Ignavibacteriaceae bacterium]|nr:YjbH domain-containing protein [Ignavibacteriaceae bacterium]
MKRLLTTLGLVILITNLVSAQGAAGSDAKFEYRMLIDMPTAGILEKGYVGETTDILPGGVVIAKLEVGVFTNVSFGISYGGANIIGTGSPKWYKLPGVNFRVRLLNESAIIPAITIGFDSQGKGAYNDEYKRYAIKSPGFFAAASKNFGFLGYLSLHGTFNYSLENKDGDEFVNLNIGIEKTIGPNISIISEYDFAWNDNKQFGQFGNGNGYLNIGFRWSMGAGFTLGLDLRDLLDNKKLNPSTADRAIRMEYIKTIF